MSNFPSGITLRTVTYTGGGLPGVGDEQIIEIAVMPLTALIWKANRWQMPAHGWSARGFDTASLAIPVTDQVGYQMPSGKDAGSPSTQYWIRVRVYYGTNLVNEVSDIVPIPTGDGSPIDLDTLLPVGTQAGGVVPAPDTWSARLDALEAGGGGSATRGLIITAVDVSTIPAGDTTDNLAAYYNSAAVPITVAGVELVAGSHAVWVWVGGAWVLLSSGASAPVDTPPEPADTVAPELPGTVTIGAVSAEQVQLTLSNPASDAAGVTGYDVSIDSGSTWLSSTGSSPRVTVSGLTLTVTGLTPSTTYPAPRVRARDAAGNTSAPLTAPEGFTTTIQIDEFSTEVLSHSPIHYYPLTSDYSDLGTGDTWLYGGNLAGSGTFTSGPHGPFESSMECTPGQNMTILAAYSTVFQPDSNLATWTTLVLVTWLPTEPAFYDSCGPGLLGPSSFEMGDFTNDSTFNPTLNAPGGDPIPAVDFIGTPHLMAIESNGTENRYYLDGELVGTQPPTSYNGNFPIGFQTRNINSRANGLAMFNKALGPAAQLSLAQAAGVHP